MAKESDVQTNTSRTRSSSRRASSATATPSTKSVTSTPSTRSTRSSRAATNTSKNVAKTPKSNASKSTNAATVSKIKSKKKNATSSSTSINGATTMTTPKRSAPPTTQSVKKMNGIILANTSPKRRRAKSAARASKSVQVTFVRDERVQELMQDVQRLRLDDSKRRDASSEEDEVLVEFGHGSSRLQMTDDLVTGSGAAGDNLYGFGASRVNKMAKANAESYFISIDPNQVATSNHTLDRLRRPRLTQSDMDRLLDSEDASTIPFNRAVKRRSVQLERGNFEWWRCLLGLNFNVVLFGLGSKKGLLDEFRSKMLSDVDVVVIDGFFPSLTLKPILNVITEGILGVTEFASQREQLAFLTDHYSKEESDELYLVVHNIDGPMLRSGKMQDFLANLASLNKVHLICSIDHINAGVMWDQSKLSLFSFVYFDATTFKPYVEECRNERSLMVKQSGSLVLSSLVHVFASLTPNAKAIFRLIAKFQLEAMKEKKERYKGMPFATLYSQCSERFLVNSDLTLRSQLVEFTDHELVQLKTTNRSEKLVIPIEVDTLQAFLDTQEEDDDCPF